jgi:hypothetical protein
MEERAELRAMQVPQETLVLVVALIMRASYFSVPINPQAEGGHNLLRHTVMLEESGPLEG